MKKAICIFLIVAIVVCTLTVVFSACSKKINTINHNNVASGGWGYTTSFDAPTIPDAPQQAFDKATNGKYNLVSYLGSQVVAGTNYAYLCTKGSELYVLTVYNDLDDNCKILDKWVVNPDDYRIDSDMDFPVLYGGWTCDEAVGTTIDENAKAAFDDANQLDGVSYEPLALIATQVVGGFNYEFICKATPSVDAPSKLAVVTIFASADGENMITSQCPLNINE